MQREAFRAVIGLAQAGVGIVNGADAHLMAAGEAQTEADPVLELEG